MDENTAKTLPSEPVRHTTQHVRKRDGVALHRLHVQIPKELERALSRYCYEKEQTQGEVVTLALKRLLEL